MRNVVQIDDCTQNLDVVTFDAVKTTLDVEVYILKQTLTGASYPAPISAAMLTSHLELTRFSSPNQ